VLPLILLLPPLLPLLPLLPLPLPLLLLLLCAGIHWLGSSFLHDPGASDGWLSTADAPTGNKRAVVKVWAVDQHKIRNNCRRAITNMYTLPAQQALFS
jgi:hypothetical protein